MLKLAQTNQPTDQPTDRAKTIYPPLLYLTKPTDQQTGQKQYVPHYTIIRTNVLTKFHEDLTVNATFRMLTWINFPPPGSHVFPQTGTILEPIQEIIKSYVLMKCYEDWTTNKKMPRPWWPYFSTNQNHFCLVQDIIGTNLLTKFHDHGTMNVAFKMLTRFYYAMPPGGHLFQATRTIIKLLQDIIGTNLLTKFHDDGTINVVYSVNKKQDVFVKHNTNRQGKNNMSPTTIVGDIKMLRPLGGLVFQPTGTIFKLIQDIIRNKSFTSIFQDIIETNLLTKFHED
ncbi:hypothetical protein DPMN_010784 [Dreissena polymorpha]|uniref:Uncharacterized protein n=1 Tax=Dreissena polymorpha TaxID=45954 RepID=A0A9D4RZK9_DREPO|nr:hypothetical protein DPMN_010784 [Dreissena polymorpha]